MEDIENYDAKIVLFRFLRVVFGITSSPFLLNGTIRHHLDKYIPSDREFVENFLEDLYVDDEISGCATVEEGIHFYRKAKKIMSEAGFNLRKWVTNNSVIQSVIEEKEGMFQTPSNVKDELTYSEIQFNVEKEYQSVLGLKWDPESDE